jgi:betaine reductase
MVRIVHYLNQFFGQIGGEDKAGSNPFVREGPVGPGTLIEQLLAGQGKVIATVICGDNYFAERGERAAQEVFSLIKDFPMDIFIAGPAFNAGRYGIGCGETCKYVKEKTAVPAITGMFPENPGVELYKRHVYIIGTTDNAAGMREAMPKMLSLALKLYHRQPIGRPEEEGYLPQGIKKTILSDRLASERAIDLLLKKLKGEAYCTEVLFSGLDVVPLAPPVANMAEATIALVTEGGLVPRGNPDGLESSRAMKYVKYRVEELEKEGALKFQSIHIGFDTNFINEDPNRLVPLDALRELESEGRFKKIHPEFFVTTGVGTTMENSRKIGERMAAELCSAGVSAAILTAT